VLAFQALKDSVTGMTLTATQTTTLIPVNVSGTGSYVTPWSEIPVDQDLLQVAALSVNLAHNQNSYASGVTPVKVFQTPPLDPTSGGTTLSDVTNFAMGARYGYDPGGSGNYDLIIQPTFTPPNDPAWQAIAVIVEAPAGSGNYVALDPAKFGNGDPHDLTEISPSGFPTSPQTWNAWAISIDVNGRLKYPNWASGVFGTAPTFSFPVPITSNPGTAEEFSGLVTGYGASLNYSLSADGTEGFSFSGSWTDSTDLRFAGVRPVVYYTGSTQPYNLGDVNPGIEQFTTNSWPVPTGSVGGTLYLLSIDSSGRANPIAVGTPFFNFIVSAQTAGVILANRLKPSTIGPGLQPLAGQLTVQTRSGLALSAGDIVVNAGSGISLAGGTTNTNPGAGLTNTGGQIIVQAGNGITTAGGSTAVNNGSGIGFASGQVVPNTGGAVAIVGGDIVVNVGPGVVIASSAVAVNTGAGLTTSGSQVVASLGSGITTSSGNLTLNLGSSLSFSGGAAVVSPTYVYPGTIVCSQLVAGTITAAVTMTSPSLVITGSGFVCHIDSTNGVKLTSGSTFAQMDATGSIAFVATSDGTNVCQMQPGILTVLGAGSLLSNEITLSTNSGSPVVSIGSSGATSPILKIGGSQVLTKQQFGPGAATGTLADVVSKFNTLYAALQTHGLVS
jgi:hypothetical protein